MCDIIDKCTPSLGTPSQHSSAHHVQFLFRSSDGHELKHRVYLAEMLSKACEVKLAEIIAVAIKCSEADLAEKASAAKAEAVETLETIEGPYGQLLDPYINDHIHNGRRDG